MLDDMSPLAIPGKSPRERALAVARDIRQLVPIEAPQVPYALANAPPDLLQNPKDEAFAKLRNTYVRTAVASRETNRFRLRGAFWAKRTLEECVREDPSDRECEELALEMRALLREAWLVPDALVHTTDIAAIERFTRGRCRLTPNVVFQAVVYPETAMGRA